MTASFATTPMRAGSTIVLDADGDRSLEAYLARPAAGHGPAILLLTEMWGVTTPKLDLADAYAGRGFCTLVPNVFWRSEPSGVISDEGPAREIAWARLRAFDFERAGEDMRKALARLRAEPTCNGKVAAIGFCLGGRLAYLAATRAGADAAVALYALGIAQHLDEMARARGPVQLHYGLADKHVPLSEIEAVQRAAESHPNVAVYGYEGAGHGFFNSARATFDPAAVALAEQRIARLLDEMKTADRAR